MYVKDLKNAFLYYDEVYMDYDEDHLDQILDLIRPDNSLIIIQSKKYTYDKLRLRKSI